MIEFLKHDCMWSGNCDRKCQGKMESFLSKSPFSNDNLNEIYFNLCGGQMFTNGHESIDLLDSLEAEDFNLNDLMNGFSSNQNHQLNNNCQQQQTSNNQFNNYYQCQPQQTNYACQQSVKSSTNFNNNTISLVNINQIQQQQPQNNHQQPQIQQQPTNQIVAATKTFVDSSSLLNSSLNNNDLLMNSNSANIILTQHNQQVDNSQLPNQNSNQINYNQTSLNTNLNNLNNQDLVSCANETASIGNSIHSATSNLNSLNTHPTNQHTSFSNYQNMINYGFDNNFNDSTFCSPCHVTDSAGSSSNSECSSSVLLERTDYDTDDIEDDLDLLEDIIEEECDDPSISLFQRSSCHSIANSLESCSDVEMVASPISDSLINDHSYGASSIEVLTNHSVSNPLGTNTTITNVQSSYANQPNSTTRTLINHHRNHQTELKSTKVTNKRKSLANLNNTTSSTNQTNGKKNLQRHSGTSLLMKDKQSKMKKVMDTDRRKEHNESERMRRDVLKNAFLTLRNRCPKLQSSSKKSSRIQILNEATLFIKDINKQFKQLDVIRQKEVEINKRLKSKIDLLLKDNPHLKI